MKVIIWSAKEAKFISLSTMFSAGACLAVALSDAVNSLPIWRSIVMVLLSAISISVALFIFDDYSAQFEEK